MGYKRRADPARAPRHSQTMPTLLPATSSRLEPIDIPYRHGQELRNGAHFVVLPTLEALESHWGRIRHLMPFAARGNCPGNRPLYLRPNEWIFALTRAKLVEAVMRWNEVGIQPVWYDWKTENPDEYAYYFGERESTRLHRINCGNWTKTDEEKYSTEVACKNPDNYTGWWRLTNLPYGHTHESWFSGLLDDPSNPNISRSEMNMLFQHRTFVDWKYQCLDEVIFMEVAELEEEIEDMRIQKTKRKTRQ
jgi:hypothetical protein